MLIEEIRVGEKYKVKAPNASGWYVVKEIRMPEDKDKSPEIIVKGKEAFIRTLSAEMLIANKKPQQKKIISAGSKEVFDCGDGMKLNVEEITYWPAWGARGRPRKS